MENYFVKLNSINCNDKVETKNGLTYLAWAYAWGEVKKLFPDANYTIYENDKGWNYHTDGRTCWVKTGVTINNLEHIEYLPVMDFRNNSIPFEKVNSFDVNKAIQRSLTKAVARHGLGLYIYAGEDLPEAAEDAKPTPAPAPLPKKAKKGYEPMDPEAYWKVVKAYAEGKVTKTGTDYKTAWMQLTNAGAEEVKKFDNDVANIKAAGVPFPPRGKEPRSDNPANHKA